MKQFILTLVILAAFVLNAYAHAEGLERGDINAAAEAARTEQKTVASEMNFRLQYIDVAPDATETASNQGDLYE